MSLPPASAITDGFVSHDGGHPRNAAPSLTALWLGYRLAMVSG